MKSRKGIPGFGMSEPEFLISVMDRHDQWATIICLVGGGQEINTGEAGIAEWFRVLCASYPDWTVYIPNNLVDSEYTDARTQKVVARIQRLEKRQNLHLATSVRSFRAESVSAFVKAFLDRDRVEAMILFLPDGNDEDHTRRRECYDCTYEYSRSIGIPDLAAR